MFREPDAHKIAVLLNTPKGYSFTDSSKYSFKAAFALADPRATLHFFDPIYNSEYPAPLEYDLIVLSGGTTDITQPDPWVLELIGYLRNLAQNYPAQKVLGICWGHQAIHVALGGVVRPMAVPEIGVTGVLLTERGHRIFPFATTGDLKIIQFHKREVVVPGEGMFALAHQHQVSLSSSGNILSFQGHPEMPEQTARLILDDADDYTRYFLEEELVEISNGLGSQNSGRALFSWIASWMDMK